VEFIQKPYREEELLDKIQSALEKDADQRESLNRRQEIVRRIETLTPREREIMDRMIAGQANKVIAIELDISQRTVEIHRSRVMHKMGTHSLAHLVRMVLSVKDLIDDRD
jgi:FixJ family two-component response regulator